MERVSIGDGCEILVEEAIDTADKNDGWVVIEALHLAHPSFFISLRQLLQRVAKSRGRWNQESLRSFLMLIDNFFPELCPILIIAAWNI